VAELGESYATRRKDTRFVRAFLVVNDRTGHGVAAVADVVE